MILTGREIEKQIQNGAIEIDPFNPSQLNPNSYNLCLGPDLAWYALDQGELNPRTKNRTYRERIPDTGMVLQPGRLYLGHTLERTASMAFVPMLEGRSSVARLGVTVHQTGGVGDLGFNGQWVLEISAIHPVRIYPGMQICQVIFLQASGEVTPYVGRYQGQSGPVECRLHLDH